ncbi:diamine acetyltransferase 2-like [Mizuhopecten yessoensis]|uniref:diamine acetyltransferase 2-like n=1 Tax=Mizuhopecten yessoensis TaxID=6573 RepID=UPI000B458F84|nr:diamine acetyltransferase 2-like [Mizuhopecten yessoensis]
MSEFTIRRADEEDKEEIYRMCVVNICATLRQKELAKFSDDVVTTTPESLRRDRKFYESFVVEASPNTDAASKSLIGYALYYYSFSSWDGRSAFLNDIYVCPKHRGKGIGSTLLKRVAQDVVENGCVLLEWCVLNYNTSAIEFYKSKGAIDLTETDRIHVYRLPTESLEKLAK